MALTIDNDNAIHEAGHAIIAYLASGLFKIKYITTNVTISREEDSNSLGGLKAELIKKKATLTIEDHDIILLILFAGLCADEVNNNNSKLNSKLYDYDVFFNKIQSPRYSGDYKLLSYHLNELVNNDGLDKKRYVISCQKILYKIFTINWIIEILINLRDEINNSENQTLSGEEIKAFLDSTKLKEWRDEEWNNIRKERIEKLKIKKYITGFPERKQTWLEKFFKFF